MIFVPILKTKDAAEPVAIDMVHHLFGNDIIPYIEITKEDSAKSKVLDKVRTICHFEQIYRKQKSKKNDAPLSLVISRTIDLLNNPNTTVALQLIGRELETEFGKIEELIDTSHKNKKSVGIRIDAGSNIEKVNDLGEKLNSDDYLIIDISDQSYSSSRPYIKFVNQMNHSCKILVFCDERPSEIRSDAYAELGYNSFHTSLVQAIKDSKFIGDGFGSYCSAKNDLYEGGNKNTKTHALFLIYDYAKNSFFSIKSKEKNHISIAYSGFKEFVKSKQDTWIKLINQNTPITYNMLMDFFNGPKKGNASRYISIGIVHYIEEIALGVLKRCI